MLLLRLLLPTCFELFNKSTVRNISFYFQNFNHFYYWIYIFINIKLSKCNNSTFSLPVMNIAASNSYFKYIHHTDTHYIYININIILLSDCLWWQIYTEIEKERDRANEGKKSIWIYKNCLEAIHSLYHFHIFPLFTRLIPTKNCFKAFYMIIYISYNVINILFKVFLSS